MINPSSQLRRNILLFIFIIVFTIVVFNLPLIFNETFLRIKNIIEESASRLLDKNVTIEKIGFLPYGELILYNIKIYDNENKVWYLSAKRCSIQFKLLPLIIKRAIVVTKLKFAEPIFYPALKNLRTNNKEEKILNYRVEFDRNLLMEVVLGSAVFDKNKSLLDGIGFSFWLKLKKNNKIYSEGSIDLKDCGLKHYLSKNIYLFESIDRIGYRLETTFAGNLCSLDELVLDFGQFKIGAVGFIENYKTNPNLDVNLYLKEPDFSKEVYFRTRSFIAHIRNFIMQIKGALRERQFSIKLDMIRSKFIYLPAIFKIDNFYCSLKLSKEELVVEDFSCFVNNFPIGLECKLSNFESPSIELKLISYPDQLPSLRSSNPLNFEFSFSGYKYGDSFKGNIFLQIERLIPREEKTKTAKFVINDLEYRFLDREILSLEAKEVIYIYAKDLSKPEIKLELADFRFLLYAYGKKVYFHDISLSGYKGILKGKGFFDFEIFPPAIFVDFEFDGIDMAELAGVFHFAFDLAGSLNGKGVFDSKASPYLAGTAAISNGFIKNLNLLNLIADFLNIISLRNIYFDNFSSDFLFFVTGDEIFLDNIKLRNKDIYLESGLKIVDRRKVKGNMLVRLSTGLLKESFKLRILFFLMGERLPYVDFEFKIGGLAVSPQIQWLDSAFKINVMRYLSESNKKAMEIEIEKMIKSLIEVETN